MTAPVITAPSKPISKGAASTGSQRDRRFTDTFWDTYTHPRRFPKGRPFTGQREFQSGSETESINAGFLQSDLQCGEYVCDNPDMGQTPEERQFTLASAWVAPWLPPGGKKYMRFNYRRKTIAFDYIKGEMDERAALQTYFLAAAKLSGANGWGEIKSGVMPSFQVTSVMGEPSKYLPVWAAARAGDPWLMGAVDEPNERLAKILGFTEPQYFGGMEFGDAEAVMVQSAPAAEPIVSAERIIATPLPDVAKMVADAVAAALAARDAVDAAKKAADKDRMAGVRAKRAQAG